MKNLSDLVKQPLRLELGTVFRLEFEGIGPRLKSSLIGVVPDEYVIVSAPDLSLYVDGPQEFPLGSVVVARYLHRGNVWGFKSELVSEISNPAHLLIIRYPAVVEVHNLRSHERVECFLPGKIEFGNSLRAGAVTDLSEQGCCFSIKSGEETPQIEIDAEVTLTCQFFGIEGEQVFTGRVRRLVKDELITTVGIEFDEVDTKVRELIADYCRTLSESR